MYIFVEGPTVTSFNGQSRSVFDLWWSTERQKRPGYNPNERRLDALAEPSDDDESVED